MTPVMPLLSVSSECYADPWTDPSSVVLQHGFCRNHRFWSGWVPHLVRRHRVLRPDLPGCGDSRHLSAEGLTLDGLATLLGDTVAATVDRPAHYVGESLGGILGVVVAATRPELIASVTLVSTPLWIDPMVGSMQALGEESWRDAIHRYGMREWWRASRVRMRRTPAETDPARDAWMAEQVAAVSEATAVALVDVIEASDVREHARAVTAPVTVLVPEGSAYANRDSQLGYYEAFEDCTIATVPGANHEMYLENCDDVAPRVAAFLAEVDGRR